MREVNYNFMTLEPTNKSNNNNSVFVWVQNGVKYKSHLNSMIKLYIEHGKNTFNPSLGKNSILGAKTLNRLKSKTNKMLNKRRNNIIKGKAKFNNSNNENSNFEN